ncbi:MAG: prolipoprotein diacylglyceryl transferase, partial [Geobacteraceae bacterium]|nr:prolipoprotein diacylglyceryl transferase [Geobacteraceae bacterium]
SHQHSYEILSAGSRLGYQVCVIAAALVGGWVIRRDSEAWDLPQRQRWSIMIAAFAGAMIGCAIPAYYAGGLVEDMAWSVPIGPKTVLGGVLGAFLLVALFKRLTKNHADTSDAFARGTIAMMAIGRIGCIMQHCCYGTPASWGIDLGDGIRRVPVQYFEAIGLFAIVALIMHLHRRNLYPGRRLFIIFSIYGALRFGLEFQREQIASVFLGIGFYQWLALTVMVVGIAQIAKRTFYPYHSAESNG